jgi:hypothetical protein
MLAPVCMQVPSGCGDVPMGQSAATVVLALDQLSLEYEEPMDMDEPVCMQVPSF